MPSETITTPLTKLLKIKYRKSLHIRKTNRKTPKMHHSTPASILCVSS